MAEVLPFKGLRYNVDVVGDVGRAVCPPYDIISLEEQEALYDRSLYNAIRLELPRESVEEGVSQDRHTRAKRQLGKWIEERVLVAEEEAALYLVHHSFTYEGRRFTRRELTGRVRLEDFGKGVIRPHEQTEEKPKEDRLALLAACQANLSPVMALYDDHYGTTHRLQERVERQSPHLRFQAPEGDEYTLWVITDEDEIDGLRSAFSPLHLYIADGHHRYEAALRYRDSRHPPSEERSPALPYDFIMMTLIDIRDAGLLALPYHRVVKGLSPSALATLRRRLQLFFDVRRFSLEEAQSNRFWLPSGSSEEEVIVGLWGLERGTFLSMRVKSKDALERLMAGEESDALRSLSPTIFRRGILKPVLDIEEEDAKKAGYLDFVKDFNEAIGQVSEGGAQIAFILAPVPLPALTRVADGGERLPPKSTYFYPKLATGLTFYSFIEG